MIEKTSLQTILEDPGVVRLVKNLERYYEGDEIAMAHRLADVLNVPKSEALKIIADNRKTAIKGGKDRLASIESVFDIEQYVILKNKEHQLKVKREINDCCRDDAGMYCSCDGGGGGSGGGDSSKSYPSGRIGGSVGGGAWRPVSDNSILVMHEPLELGDKATPYQAKLGDVIAAKYPTQISRENATEQIRLANIQAYEAIPVADRLVKDIAPAFAEKAEVEARVKGAYSQVDKTMRKPEKYDSIYKLDDVIGLRIIPIGENMIANQQEAASYLEKNYTVVENDNSTVTGRADGYRAVHMTLKDEQTGIQSEVQIKTPRQDTWSHWSWSNLYKNEDLPARYREDIELHRNEADSYAIAMSKYYYDLDSGKTDAVKPDCPDFIGYTVGCLP